MVSQSSRPCSRRIAHSAQISYHNSSPTRSASMPPGLSVRPSGSSCGLRTVPQSTSPTTFCNPKASRVYLPPSQCAPHMASSPFPNFAPNIYSPPNLSASATVSSAISTMASNGRWSDATSTQSLFSVPKRSTSRPSTLSTRHVASVRTPRPIASPDSRR